MRRSFPILAATLLMGAVVCVPAQALVTSKTPAGANHEAAHNGPHLSTGFATPVGVIEIGGGVDTTKTSIDNDGRLIKNLNFIGVPTPVAVEPADVGALVSAHATQVADVVGSSHALFTGVAPDAMLYVGAVRTDAEIFGAAVWFNSNDGVGTFNFSLGGAAVAFQSTRNHTETQVTLTNNGDSTNITTNPFNINPANFQSIDNLSYRLILRDADIGPGEFDNGNLRLNIGGILVAPFNSTIATDGTEILFTGTVQLTPVQSQSLLTTLTGSAGDIHIQLQKTVNGVPNDVTPTNDNVLGGFNLPARLTLRQFNDGGNSKLAQALDWHSYVNDTLMVAAAGNAGVISGQVESPGDLWNGISVGAVNTFFTKRANFSSFRQSVGTGKPDVVAPGQSIVTEGYAGVDGTSFAAPHVAGISALLEAGTENTAGLVLGSGGNNHLAVKAIIMNSARKRFAVAPENQVNTNVRDNDSTNAAEEDGDYLDNGLLRVGNGGFANSPRTASWTPADWSYGGSAFITLDPLDDELGTGLVDAERALIQLDGGQQGPGNVTPIGWDIGFSQAGISYDYTLDFPVIMGDFLTITLAWDRKISRTDDGDGQVDFADTFAVFSVPDLDLRVYFEGNLVASSIALATGAFANNVEHLHIPFMADGDAGDYEIRVGGAAGGANAYYGLAWWTTPIPEPASVALLAIGTLLIARRRAA